ncbi:hypothetical protein PTKIN_Ptkin08bG0188000 [Pterospermum kingtungense]
MRNIVKNISISVALNKRCRRCMPVYAGLVTTNRLSLQFQLLNLSKPRSACNFNPGPSGIGGVLRDHTGRVLIKFSKAIGVTDSSMAEVLAIREIVVMFVTSQWVVNESLIIECDSRNAVG